MGAPDSITHAAYARRTTPASVATGAPRTSARHGVTHRSCLRPRWTEPPPPTGATHGPLRSAAADMAHSNWRGGPDRHTSPRCCLRASRSAPMTMGIIAAKTRSASAFTRTTSKSWTLSQTEVRRTETRRIALTDTPMTRRTPTSIGVGSSVAVRAIANESALVQPMSQNPVPRLTAGCVMCR